ncbi:hypothetical protein CBS101457_006524 [Exobasidium rhododendri]|nr:hypothetical protein CBS101457_006524 [Exobasidium rhododendri]
MDRLYQLSHYIVRLPAYLLIPLLLGAAPIAAALLFASYLISKAFYRVLSARVFHNDIYDHLPRPKSSSWLAPLYGDLGAIREAQPAEAHIQWIKDLQSNVYVYRGALYSPRLMMADSRAMNYVLGQGQSYEYPKPEGSRKFLEELLGNGLLVAEGDVHKRQKKILQPAFSVSAIRNLTPTFFRHSNDFAEVLAKLVDSTEGPSDEAVIAGQSALSSAKSEKGKPVFDISYWLSKVTLDIIGDAGFDHQFQAVISKDGDEISTAFGNMMRTTVSFTPLIFLQFVLQSIPGLGWIRFLPTKRREVILNTHEVLQRASKRIITRKRVEIQEEINLQGAVSTQVNEKSFFENGAKSKDLLYLMMKANMAKDVKKSEKLDDAELLGQMTTLLLAGHETTSTLTTWLLNVISAPDKVHIQNRLREEVEETFAGRDELDYDSLMAMPYLDMVTKEILRFRSPVTSTIRTASKDDVIPLSQPYKTKDGKGTFDSLVISKGLDVIIPIQVINRLESVWGPTADQFDPSRWEKIPSTAKSNGMPQHHLSFLSGPRGCVGREFAIAEFKAIVCSMVRLLKFEAIEGWVVEPKQGIVIRPRIVGQEDLGMQMPLRVSRVLQV